MSLRVECQQTLPGSHSLGLPILIDNEKTHRSSTLQKGSCLMNFEHASSQRGIFSCFDSILNAIKKCFDRFLLSNRPTTTPPSQTVRQVSYSPKKVAFRQGRLVISNQFAVNSFLFFRNPFLRTAVIFSLDGRVLDINTGNINATSRTTRIAEIQKHWKRLIKQQPKESITKSSEWKIETIFMDYHSNRVQSIKTLETTWVRHSIRLGGVERPNSSYRATFELISARIPSEQWELRNRLRTYLCSPNQ